MLISKDALPFIKLQRTDYCQYPDIESRFIADIEQEFLRIKPYLPLTANSILDVGCGVAGIDILLYEHYNRNVDICLLDKTEITSGMFYGFKDKPEFYNSLMVAKALLELNNVRANNIFLQEATTDCQINFDIRKFDIIISLISWGFHYPIETYMSEVFSQLNGILILDVRKGTSGQAQIEEQFGPCKIIYDAESFLRLAVKKSVEI